jgi:hypothetical protein
LRAMLWRRVRRCLALVRGRSAGGDLRGILFLLMAITGAGFALAGDSATGEAREYSAYDDPQKPAISFILSEEQNVEEFREKFSLSEAEVERALAAVRRENRALAREYGESEQIVEANEELPAEQVADRIAASDYDEEVRAAVAETKATIEALLPEDRRSELGAWVDAKFVQAGQEFSDGTMSAAGAGTTRGRGVRCRVFATQYHGYTRREVALPHRKLKFNRGFSVRLRRGDHHARVRVKEVGPWNIRDNYWQSRRYRDMWDDLPRCKPEAEAAYYRNYNRGRDQFGRKVTNPAGVDLTPRVARTLGLRKYQNAWIYVRYPWVRR